MRCIEETVIFGFQGYKVASLVHSLSRTQFLMSAGSAYITSSVAIQGLCSACVDKNT